MRGERPLNSFSCLPFSRASFEQQVRTHSHGASTSHRINQVEYLKDFLTSLGAASLLVESHYIDRHFVDEVSLYYSRCLLSKPNSCARIHVFRALSGKRKRRLHGPGVLDDLLDRAASGEWETVNEELRAAYLGYVVVRPLPSVPIGRTVLAAPQDAGRNGGLVTVRYTVHVLGFEIPLETLAFQQQDRAVGACATAAVWMALQRSCKHEGDRPPTPSAITEAAVRYYSPGGRSLPSSGLTMEQICEALRHFEFPPEVLYARDLNKRELRYFQLRLHVYLRSGMPVILAVNTPGGGHAVTVAGDGSENPPRVYLWINKNQVHKPLELGPLKASEFSKHPHKLRLLNLAYDHLYIHDDRLGPYVLARLETQAVSPDRDRLLLTSSGRMAKRTTSRFFSLPCRSIRN